MPLIFYYVVGQRANATKLNKLTDRCKIKKKTGDKISSSTRGTEGPLRLVIMATSALHHCAIQLHATNGVYLNDFKFVWRKLRRFANCTFFLPEQLFLCTKECLTIFKYLEMNWDGLQTDTNDFLRFTTVFDSDIKIISRDNSLFQ